MPCVPGKGTKVEGPWVGQGVSIATVLGTRPQQVLIDKDVWSVLKARRLCDVCSPPSV